MYLQFACCASVPGGGRNKEYALHLLHMCRGNIRVIKFLITFKVEILKIIVIDISVSILGGDVKIDEANTVATSGTSSS